ncbi:MAG: MBL fold metallo-hydrolase [Firmicutes bacterium]|nr:MBL fold metallo-hydrolase [Bacillota bacterium]
MEIKRFIGGILEANCYVITASDSKTGACYIIDPGYNPKNIIKYVKKQGMKPEGIILTHHHSDHVGGASQIRKELECPVMIHTADADRYGDEVDVYLEEGMSLRLGDSGEKLVVYHTPGHTKGGVCLMSSESKVCFTGDTIFNVDLGRTDLDDGSEREMCKTIRDICDKWGNDITIYPGHGDPATMKTVRKINKEFLEIVNGN